VSGEYMKVVVINNINEKTLGPMLDLSICAG
jgi:hypothetical protein